MNDIRNDDRKEEREEHWEHRAPSTMKRWLVILALLLLAVAVIGGGNIYEQGMATSNLTTQNHLLQFTVDQMRTQVGALTAKLDQMATPSPAQEQPATAPGATRTTPSSSAAQDRRMRQVQSQLANQRKQLKETQDQVAAAKSDFEGKLGSTRDELNRSIAKTHDELVGLEKRGERNYFEFDLSKSKTFQREGPIQISLRKADSKHQSYDMIMLVDDHQLTKKKVDLYEPVWLHESDQPEPVQVVVNKIDKDRIHGYVSAPKYRESELSSSAPQPSGESVSNKVSTPSPSSSSNSTSTPSSPSTTSSQDEQSPME
jgi:uncharacterized coiled-coil protein SlyX